MKIAKVERGDGWRVRQNRSDHSINRISYREPISRVLPGWKWKALGDIGRGLYSLCLSLVYIVCYLRYQSVSHSLWWIHNLTERHLETAEFGTLRKTTREQILVKKKSELVIATRRCNRPPAWPKTTSGWGLNTEAGIDDHSSSRLIHLDWTVDKKQPKVLPSALWSDANDTSSPVQLPPSLHSLVDLSECLSLGSGHLVGRRLGGLERNSKVNDAALPSGFPT